MKTTLDAALDRIDGVEGWLTRAQAATLFEAAAAVPAGGRIVEIGSFRGRSTIVLASGAGEGVAVVAIDPHAGNDRGPQEISGYEAEAEGDHGVFLSNLAAAGVAERVAHVRAFSSDASALASVPAGEGVDLLWVDGAHRYGPALGDLRAWGDRVVPGGRMLVHDTWSSIGVTLAVLRHLLLSRGWRYDGRVGSLAAWTKAPPAGRSSTMRQLRELPWFAANVVRKVLTVLKVRKGAWPY